MHSHGCLACGRARPAPPPPPPAAAAARPAHTTVPRSRCRLGVRVHAAAAAVKTLHIPAGEVTIGRLQPDDVQGAGLLLTRAFAGTAEAVKLEDAVQYMREQVESAATAAGLSLVARLVPPDPAMLPPGKTSRLVGTVNLSYNSSSREAFASLAPPPDEWYLANMAVDPKFRRQGIARSMLAAADDAAQAAGQAVVWLHVRSADEAAQALYTGFGYEEVDRDAPKLGLFGLGGSGSGSSKARVLMRRRLQPPPAAAAAGA